MTSRHGQLAEVQVVPLGARDVGPQLAEDPLELLDLVAR